MPLRTGVTGGSSSSLTVGGESEGVGKSDGSKKTGGGGGGKESGSAKLSNASDGWGSEEIPMMEKYATM